MAENIKHIKNIYMVLKRSKSKAISKTDGDVLFFEGGCGK
jgi:hypothetical protein